MARVQKLKDRKLQMKLETTTMIMVLVREQLLHPTKTFHYYFASMTTMVRGILLRTQSKEVQHRLLCYPLGNIIVIFKKYTS